MKLGDLVVILGAFDKRVHDHDDTKLAVGTLEQELCDNQVSILMEDGTIWVGNVSEIAPYEEQQ